jgi:hypothetical protein
MAPPPVDKGSSLSVAQQPVAEQVGYHQAWTYCSACCPDGPEFCPQVGFGEGLTSRGASDRAIAQCVANNGYRQYCEANVRVIAGEFEDLPF